MTTSKITPNPLDQQQRFIGDRPDPFVEMFGKLHARMTAKRALNVQSSMWRTCGSSYRAREHGTTVNSRTNWHLQNQNFPQIER